VLLKAQYGEVSFGFKFMPPMFNVTSGKYKYLDAVEYFGLNIKRREDAMHVSTFHSDSKRETRNASREQTRKL